MSAIEVNVLDWDNSQVTIDAETDTILYGGSRPIIVVPKGVLASKFGVETLHPYYSGIRFILYRTTPGNDHYMERLGSIFNDIRSKITKEIPNKYIEINGHGCRIIKRIKSFDYLRLRVGKDVEASDGDIRIYPWLGIKGSVLRVNLLNPLSQ